MSGYTVALILLVVINFILLARRVLRTDVGMTLTALGAMVLLAISDPDASLHAVQSGASKFAKIAVLFTAIAVPSHMLARSEFLDKIGMHIGETVGRLAQGRTWLQRFLRLRIDHTLLVVAICLTMTYAFAATLHNTTSILISVTVITTLCRSYRIPSVPILSGALVASNLGGFSTRWGDTPNIVEAQTWGLTHQHFFSQILLVNVGLMMILILVVTFLTRYVIRRGKFETLPRSSLAYSMIQFRTRKRNIVVNRRLMSIGLGGLVLAVGGSLFVPRYEVPVAALTIVVCVLGDYTNSREHALFALGMETYATLASIFVLAEVMADSPIGLGPQLADALEASDAAVPVIVVLSYFGTLFTEAASWATAASPIVHAADPSPLAAWALGSGICAGSSSLITAATAGVILLNETSDSEPEDRVTFANYIPFGLGFSVLMLVYYMVVLSLAF